MDIEDRIANNLGKTLKMAAEQMKKEISGKKQMYLVLMVRHDRVISVKAFRNFDLATFHADNLVMSQNGVSNDMPDWEDSDFRNVFTAHNGISIMIEPCDEPEMSDNRFQSSNYGVNLI